MAYAAVISLKHSIIRYSTHNNHISTVPNSSLYDEVVSLQQALKELDHSSSRVNRETVNRLDEQIREAVCEFQDLLDQSHVTEQIIHSFIQKVNQMRSLYLHELHNPLPPQEEDDSDDDVSGREESEVVVGLSNEFNDMNKRLTERTSRSKRMSRLSGPVTISLVGMAGIGKTALAKKLYGDKSIRGVFERCAFVTLGPKYELQVVLRDIIKQLDPDFDEAEEMALARLRRLTYKSLMDRRYLIVLDDVWDASIWYDLIPLFPDDSYGNRVLLTTRLLNVADAATFSCRLSLLDNKESWLLLCEKVFGGESCSSYQLEKAGKKIAKNCEGLPLTIVTVADILAKDEEKTLESWNSVALNKHSSVFIDAYGKMSKVLYPSYNYLPQHLKACFLYMGVFPQNYEIPCSVLINLWRAEGFTDDVSSSSDMDEYLVQLFSRSLVMVHKHSYSDGMKTISLQSPFWYLCNKEAGQTNLFHGFSTFEDGYVDGIKTQRRLSIRNNILLGIEELNNFFMSISTVRSLLCTGPPIEYPVPICLGSRLLRVLDALKIRFYDLPIELLDLIHLTYLAITFNGMLPPSISNLSNLQYLIIHRHLSIVKPASSTLSYLPTEIWDMQELHHLQVPGSSLTDDPCDERVLPKLVTLSDVSHHSCTKHILDRIPNLQKLGIRIELALRNAKPLRFFDHVSHLDKLKTLKCIVVNPRIASDLVPLSTFPSSLVKLTLSGFGYPWEEMSKISLLPKLRVLKLRCHAFRGRGWEVRDHEFPRLEFLSIDNTDLEQWKFRDYFGLNTLKSFSLKYCYKLETIPLKFGEALERLN